MPFTTALYMEILIIVLLILLNGLFSMSEIALVSSRKFRLESAARKGDSNAKKALELAGNPNKFLSTVQIGITLIGILTGIFSGEEIAEKMKAAIARVDILAPYSETLGILAIVIIVTFLSIVFGELLPKRIGLLFPEKISIVVARPMTLLSIIAAPFIWLLAITNNLFLRMFGIKEDLEARVTEEEIKAIVQQGAAIGEIQEIEHSIVDRVFGLGDRRVAELMTHRTDIKWLDKDDDLETIVKKAKEELHTIYPVADKTLDNLVGIISIKEIFAANLQKEHFDLRKFIKKPLIVHENTSVYLSLELFRQHHFHNAIVVDEYGSVQGIISMDDIVDALVGDVSENTQLEYSIVKRDEESWLVDGQYPYFELLNYFDIHDADEQDEERDFNTIAGLLLHKAGRIPVVGEKFEWKQFWIEVVDMDKLRIDKVLIYKKR